MKKLLTILFILFTCTVFGQVKGYRVWSTNTLEADHNFIWQGDSIQHDSLIYVDIKPDSLRVKYINGIWSKWYYSNHELDSIYVTNNSRWYKGGDTLTISTGSSRSETPLSATANTSYTHDVSVYINSKVSTNTAINITLSNLGEGQTGNIEIVYTGAAVVTFIVDSSYTLDVSPNIFNATTNAYTVSILSKSTGHYITSYYRSGLTVYINGR